MARQKINILERHVEKAVVVLFGAVLCWTVYAYGLKSPNTIDLGGQQVGPGQVDEKVLEKAKSVYSRIASHKPEKFEIEDLPARQKTLAVGPLQKENSSIAAVLRAAVPFGPPVPVVQGPGDTGQVTLATLAPPSALGVASGRLLAYMPPGDAAVVGDQISDRDHELMVLNGPQDVPWVTLGIELNVRAQRKVFIENNYDTRKMDVQVTGIDVQRRRELGGSWSDWEDVKPYKVHYFETAPELTLEATDEGEIVPIEQRKALLTWIDEVSDFEHEVLRPRMPEEWDGDPWVPPMCAKLQQTYPDEGWSCPIVEQVVEQRKLSPRKQAARDLETARTLLEQGLLDEAEAKAEEVAGTRDAPKKLREEANALLEEIQDAIDQRTREEIAAEPDPDDDLFDEEGEEEPLDYEYFIVTDTSALPGQAYQYRIKLRAYNQYAGQASRLQNADDARKIEIDGEWSTPSTVVTVPAMQRIYMVGADSDDREVRFEVFKWIQGAWLKHVHRARIGETIGEEEKVQHPLTGERIKVDFATGMTLVDLYQSPFVPVKHSRKGGATVGEPELSPACLSVGTDLMLESIQERDKVDPERRDIQSQLDAQKKKNRKKKKGRP